MPIPIDVLFVLPRGSLILDWAGPAEAFRIANQEVTEGHRAATEPLRLRFAAPHPQSESSVGARLCELEPLPQALPEPAWIVLVGKTSTGQARADDAEDRAVTQWLRRLQPGREGLRLVTVCSGALLAASAGLLDGRRVTTHHLDLEALQALAPRAQVLANRVFVHDAELWSSAGVTAGIDLALHLVAHQFGPVVAARVAQRMAVALRRGPEDPALSPFLAHRQHLHARLHQVQDAVSRAPCEDWDAQRMAQIAHTTPRSLNRLFAEHAGTTPLAWLRGVRLALARSALEAGSSVTQAAELAGFSSDLQLRRAWAALGAPGSPSGRLQARRLGSLR
ncbi:MAG: helix-turn-helix domain-containing protein [Rubrivivax sp.]|nr:helix-turn-helix domain-containing protein [Rubrivivax sp.]